MAKIKNWSKFQHFKDRKPPWVKLYRELLDDIEWHLLEPKAAKVLTTLWLIASEYDGNLPDNKTLAFRLRLSEKETKDAVSKLGHWLIHDDINTISERHQDDSLETERETETEKETERDVKPPTSAKSQATRLDHNWELPDDWAIWAKQERPELNVNAVADGFKDYWIAEGGAKGRKANWFATWRNWIRNQKVSAKDRNYGLSNQNKSAPVTFAERDELNRRKRWEEMTGQQWPDNNPVIDTQTFLGIEQ